jgi:hypothetical protein
MNYSPQNAIFVFAVLCITTLICFLKGKPGLGMLGALVIALGFFFAIAVPFLGWFPIIGAIRLAKPESSWAARLYNEQKMANARARFPHPGI